MATTPVTIRRVAVLFEYPTVNGGERSLLALVHAATFAQRTATGSLDNSGAMWEFIAVGPGTGPLADALKLAGIPHRYWDCADASGTGHSASRLAEILREVAPSMVHANSLGMARKLAGWQAEFAVVPPQTPMTAHLRDIVKLTPTAITRLKTFDRLIAVSEATKTFHVSQGLPADLIEVVHNGVCAETFAPRPPTKWLHRKLALSDDAILMGSVGQIGLRKGLSFLAQAAVALFRRWPTLHWVHCGERYSTKAESIQYEAAIGEALTQAGFRERWHPLGYVAEMERVYPELAVFVHPAVEEPFGRVLLEAAACAAPIVATAVGGTREMLTNHESAMIIPPRDPDAIEAAIQVLLTNPTLATQLGLSARLTVQSRFRPEQMAAGIQAIWDHLLGKHL